MADGGKVLVNRIPYDFQSIETEIMIEGKSVYQFGLVSGLEEFDYSCTINRTVFYGCGQLPVDVAEGDAEFDASIVIHRYWFHYLCARRTSSMLGLGISC
ncbi:MAG TPA: hypothetical protein VJN18_14465 [Polyangiaceae bacterium]|nr:hypothetical protein [Polyangiaceae bacterium]